MNHLTKEVLFLKENWSPYRGICNTIYLGSSPESDYYLVRVGEFDFIFWIIDSSGYYRHDFVREKPLLNGTFSYFNDAVEKAKLLLMLR
jgi:hypothetical protein